MPADLTFTGPQALIVHDVGEWTPGESKTIDDADLAAALLKRPDFSKTTPKKSPAKASAQAKTPA